MDNKTETMLGGRPVVAAYLDGTHETVKVQQLLIRQLPEYLAAIDNENKLVELLCDKPSGWSDNLRIESHEAILAAGEELNSERFFAWLRRRVSRQEQLVPGSSGELGRQLLSTLPTT
jgi:hypothetical protein